MSEKATDETESKERKVPEKVAIEGKLPLTAIDIESQKDMKSGRYHALRSLHKWFAARPTPAARLSILASAYPGEIGSDELLKLMQIGPNAMDSNISEYVEKKFAESRTSGTLDEHYGYSNPNTQSPTKSEIDALHDTIAEAWGGEMPTVLDPTAGRGIIPFEAIRHGFPAIANELNPVPALITKVGLEYAPKIGSLESDIKKWSDKIHQKAKKNIDEYYPTKEPNRQILNSATTYLINCDSCGGEVPLVMKWWLDKTSDGGDAVKPIYDSGKVSYEHVKVQESDNNYDPDDAPLTKGDAECPHCGVVTESDSIREKIRNREFEYSVYGVNYENERGERLFRAGSKVDEEGMKKASARVKNDFEMIDFLSEPIDISSRLNDPTNYGMEEWRDIFTPRQLVAHYEYLQAYNSYKQEIQSEYSQTKSEAVLTLLAFAATRALYFNSRMIRWYDDRGYADVLFSTNNYSLKRMFGDNNISAPRRGYKKCVQHRLDSYEELASYSCPGSATTLSTDAANMSEELQTGGVDIAIVDPPYYNSVQYAELADVFYVLLKEYLEDVHPELFTSKLTNKDDEAVANPYRFRELANGDEDSDELADQHYENKMNQIFSELHNLLSNNGIVTVMFTHREMEAWDTLTTALINSGFIITSTHPIKTEKSDRVGLQGKASADSSILLTARKEDEHKQSDSILWEEIEHIISQVATEEAENIIESGYNISKTDMAITTYGPTLRKYSQEHPVVDKKGEQVPPRKALNTAREVVTEVITERFINTSGVESLDTLSRWYILSWLIYENDTFLYDEGNQLGVIVGVDIENIKNSTKIWGKRKSDIQLKSHSDRVQDIVLLKDDTVDSPSSRKYPVNPTDTRFTYTIDTVHSAIHVYEREGARAAWDWLTERNLKSDDAFEVAVTALLEVLPEENDMHNILVNLVSGETGEYLDINLDHIGMSDVDRQTSLGDHKE